VEKVPWPERIFRVVFVVFNWLDDVRRRTWPNFFITSSLTGLLMLSLNGPLSFFHRQNHWAWDLAGWVAKAGVGLCISQLFMRGLVPALRYAHHSADMRALGFHAVHQFGRRGKNYAQIVADLVKHHPKNERVRVICISGKLLFVVGGTNNEEPSPLHELAQRGMLDVIMPITNSANVTIRGRYGEYSEEYRQRCSYTSIESLVYEIRSGKDMLAENVRNTCTEHDILCMWRVVLLKKHCIVQSYFPNSRGEASQDAPVFVFVDGEPGDFGYYQTFSRMFDLVREFNATTVPARRGSGIAQNPSPEEPQSRGRQDTFL